MEAKGTRLERRPNGIWYILWTGNSRGRSTGTRDRAFAERALAAFIANGGPDWAVDGNVITVADELNFYELEHVNQNVHSRETFNYAKEYLTAHYGMVRVVDMTRGHTDDPIGGKGYIQLRRAGKIWLKRQPKPAGNGTIRRELGVLMAALLHNTVPHGNDKKARLSKDDVPVIPMPPKPAARDRWYTIEEEAAMIAATGEPSNRRLSRIYRFLVLAADTASRKRALETLTWEQVDFGAQIVNLNPPGRVQTGKRRPPVRMSNRLHLTLRRAWDERERDSDGNFVSSYVLDHPGNIRKAHATILAKAGVKDGSPHIWRHTWCTRASRAGVTMREIADFTGDDIRTIEKNYIHHSPHYLKNVADWREREAGHG
jgi:integrase